MTTGDEPAHPAAEVPPATDEVDATEQVDAPARQPEPSVSEPPHLAGPISSPPPVRTQPASEHDPFQPLEPDAFDGAIGTFEAVVRLCEQVARLGAECERRRETVAGAATRMVPPPGSA